MLYFLLQQRKYSQNQSTSLCTVIRNVQTYSMSLCNKWKTNLFTAKPEKVSNHKQTTDKKLLIFKEHYDISQTQSAVHWAKIQLSQAEIDQYTYITTGTLLLLIYSAQLVFRMWLCWDRCWVNCCIAWGSLWVCTSITMAKAVAAAIWLILSLAGDPSTEM